MSTVEQACYRTDGVYLAKSRRPLVYSYYKYQTLFRYIRSNPKQNMQEIRNSTGIPFVTKLFYLLETILYRVLEMQETAFPYS
jgi:hypothetical protein